MSNTIINNEIKKDDKHNNETKDNVIIKPGLGYIDFIVSEGILSTVALWKKLGINANGLTTIGLIASIISIYCLYKKNSIGAIIFLIVRWYCDFADGLFARKYNNISKFGDYYDHIADLLFSFGTLIVLLTGKYRKSYIKYICISLILVLFMLFSVHMGCIEERYNKKNNNTEPTFISNIMTKCPAQMEDVLKIFDNSTIYVALIVVIIIFCKQ